jgi:hypothetical protein
MTGSFKQVERRMVRALDMKRAILRALASSDPARKRAGQLALKFVGATNLR